ncbi:MAG: hypothetical protein HRU15_04405, partial [Planctomycetes bacterium]|nr:hypothetical protein [Planctomycetota bacterium]
MKRFTFQCAGCGIKLLATEDIIGMHIRCESCNVKQEVMKPEEKVSAAITPNVTKLKVSNPKGPFKQLKKRRILLMVAFVLLVGSLAHALNSFIKVENTNPSEAIQVAERAVTLRDNSKNSPKVSKFMDDSEKSIETVLVSVVPAATLSKSPLIVSKDIQGILEKYCTDCHGAKKKKGDIRLHGIANLEKDFQSNILNKIEEQLFIEKMPPDDEDQLSKNELKILKTWINSQYN